MTKKVGWVLDADIRDYSDAIDYEWLMKFIQKRTNTTRKYTFSTIDHLR